VEDLLATWLAADHRWRPSTLSGYRSVVRFLTGDPLSARRAAHLSPVVLRAACARWRQEGWPEPTIAGRVRCLRSAVRWAYAEQILHCDPLDGMRGPSPSGVRMHAPVEAVRELIAHAEFDISAANDAAKLHRAEQVLLLVRLAADCGARRGELAALRVDDLDGDVLTISRGTSCEVVGPTKTNRIRRVTLGAGVAALWRSTVRTWRDRAAATTGAPGIGGFGPWLFSAHPDHAARLTTSCLGHWFADLADRAGHGDVTLHRLRHTVATVLVGRGDLLQAQYRLGHRDASTTLRIYSHVMPLTDAQAAATFDQLYP
jgi:integrase